MKKKSSKKKVVKEYEVWLYDTFDHSDCLLGKYPTKEEAIDVAASRSGTMTLTYVYFRGERLAKYGTY